jgi:hypothetical protein
MVAFCFTPTLWGLLHEFPALFTRHFTLTGAAGVRSLPPSGEADAHDPKTLGLAKAHTMPASKFLVRLLGLALVAVSWFPMSFVERSPVGGVGSARQAGEGAAPAGVWGRHFPSHAAQLHQFRVSGGPGWISEESGAGTGKAGAAGAAPQVAACAGVRMAWVPVGLLNTWQFACRAAHHPRAPCGS